jgi:hypothetical protein
MASFPRTALLVGAVVCAPTFALLTAACGSGSDSANPGAADSAADAAAPFEAGVAADSTTAIDGGASQDASPDASSLADVITTGPTTCTLQSGSRIKIRWYEAPDGGARLFDSMYDTMLDAPCTPATTSDGHVRCLPVTLNGGGVLFADSLCSTPLYQQSDFDCTAPAYVGLTTSTGTCTAPTVAVYKVGAELPDAGTVYQPNGTGCAAATWASIYNYFALTPVPDSTFVEGTAATAAAGNYSLGAVDFSDGARYCDALDGFGDSRTNFNAYTTLMPDSTYRMVPSAAPSSGFADSNCTIPATETDNGSAAATPCGPQPPYTEDIDQCTQTVTVRAIGAELDAGWVTQYGAAPSYPIECVPSGALPQGGTWNALSAPLPTSTFDLVETQLSGTGRVQTVTWATYGGFRFAQPLTAYDSQLGALCAVTSSPAPTAACLPQTAYSGGGLYTDGSCTTPLNLVTMPDSCIPSGFPAAGTLARIGSCPPRMAHVGAQYTGAMWQKVGNACNGVGFPDDAFWSIVDDIDPSTYPQMTAVVE